MYNLKNSIGSLFKSKTVKPKNFTCDYDIFSDGEVSFDIIKPHQVSPEVLNIIREYTNNGYLVMNAVERSNSKYSEKCDKDFKPFKPFKNLTDSTEEIQRKNDLLHEELLEHTIENDIYVYKAISKGRLLMMLNKYNLILEELKNMILTDKGFVSTSLTKDSVLLDSNYRKYLLRIKVPKGTSGAFIGRISFRENENELLLNRNISMVVTDVHKEDSKLSPIIIDCTIIPNVEI